jgi:hypothetical protein
VTVYNDTIAENLSLSPAQSLLYLQYPVISEGLNISQLMDAIRAQFPTIAETLTLSDAITPLIGVVLAERLAIDQAETVNGHYNVSVAEQASFYSQLVLTLPAAIAESFTITAAEVVQRAVTVMEGLQLEEALTPTIMYHLSLSERIVVADALAKFLGAEAIDGLLITPAIDPRAYKGAQIDETLTIADAFTPQFILRVTCDETLDLTADQAVKMIFNAEVTDGIEIAGAYVAPNGSVTTWVMNTRSGAVSEYQNYAFNSFARVGNKYLAAADTGLYELLGDKDDGTDIIATIRSGFAQWSGTHLGSFKAAYLAVAGVGDYVLRIITRDGKTFNYRVTAADGRTVKVNLGKGLRSRYFAFELVSTGQDFDLDTLEFIPLVADRRV